MSEHRETIRRLIAELRPLTESEKARLKCLLAPGVAATMSKTERGSLR
jgi:hypothetical protein